MATIQPMCGLDIMSRQKARVAAHNPVVLARCRGVPSSASNRQIWWIWNLDLVRRLVEHGTVRLARSALLLVQMRRYAGRNVLYAGRRP